MNPRLQYELRGWAYWTQCLNPFKNTVTIKNLPLGLQLQAYKRDAVGRGLYRRKVHEPVLTSLLLTRFATPARRNFMDVGANIGYFSCLMAKLAGPFGKVLAIEPEPQNVSLLRQNIAANHLSNVEIHPCAAGASPGTAMLGIYKPSNRGRHSILETNAKSRVEVPVRTLDELARNSAKTFDSWSLMKIDVEGYEGFVMEGARETLQRVEAVVMEFSPALLKMAGQEPAAIIDTLSNHFPRIYRMENPEPVRVTVKDCLRIDNQVELMFER